MNGEAVYEVSARAMIDEVIAEVQLKFSKKPAEERAFILIKGFLDASERICEEGDIMPDYLSAEFFDWFHHPRNYEAKMRALERVMKATDEKLLELGFSCSMCRQTSVTESGSPNFDRLKQILGNNQTRI